MTETATIDEIREWRRSRRSAGHSSDSDLLALGRLVEKRWLEDGPTGGVAVTEKPVATVITYHVVPSTATISIRRNGENCGVPFEVSEGDAISVIASGANPPETVEIDFW